MTQDKVGVEVEVGSVGDDTKARRPSALLVDDDGTSLKQLDDLLQEAGFDCRACDSGVAALTLLQRGSYDLVVANAMMPDVDGSAILAFAKLCPRKPALAFVTGLNDSDAAVQALRREGLPILFKPLDPSDLGHTVAWLMHERHLALHGVPAGDLPTLYRIATAANSGMELPQLLDRILASTMAALGGDGGSIMLASNSSDEPRTLTIAASFGLRRDSEQRPVPFGQKIAGWVAENARPIRLVGCLTNYPQFRHMGGNPSRAEALVAPLLFGRNVIGTISINSSVPGSLGAEKLALLMCIAELVATAVHRGRVEKGREHQDRLAVLGQLSASIAHELNNPLAILKSNAGELAALVGNPDSPLQSLPAFQRELLEVVKDLQDSAERMESLVSPLRGASRRPTAELQEVDLNVLLRRAEVLVHPQMKHRVRLTVECGQPPPVKVDAGRITQILINLLVNAAHAVGKDGHVVLRSRTEDDHAVIEVEDNGSGIPDEVSEHIFEPFFTTKPEGEGTGLGLSISRQIAREYGGGLTFTTKVGSGTCFRLTLPAASALQSRRPVILVVDDEPSLVAAIGRTLRDNFEILPATSAEQAVTLAQGRKLDLVLTDLFMPGMTGLELVRVLRDNGQDAPAVLLTALPNDEKIPGSLTSGLIAKVITKPWNTAVLVSELNEVLVADNSV